MDTTPQDQSKLKDSAKDAVQTLKALALNPVGGFSSAFDSLGSARALGVGIIYGAAFALCLIFATYFVLSDWGGPQGFTGFVKVLIISVVPFISFLGAATATRKVLRAEGSLGHDSFIAGASLLPFGCTVLIGALLGRIQLRFATPTVVKRPRRPDLSRFTAKWSCPWPQAA